MADSTGLIPPLSPIILNKWLAAWFEFEMSSFKLSAWIPSRLTKLYQEKFGVVHQIILWPYISTSCPNHYSLSSSHATLYNPIFVVVIIIIIIIILTANGFLPGSSGTTITHITQNNTTIKQNTAHKTTHTINTIHKMNTRITTTII
jgi:hypothetical protein